MNLCARCCCQLSAILFAAVGPWCVAAEFFVTPNGQDTNCGSRAEPFATIVRARDAVRKELAAGLDEDVSVFVGGGLYRLDETIVFGLEDSADNGHTITYAATAGATPVLSSGVPVTGWKKVDGPPLVGVTPAATGNLWVADLPEGLAPFLTLYDGAQRLPRARGRGMTPARRLAKPRHADWPFRLELPAGALEQWPHLGKAEIFIVPQYPWVSNLLPVLSVNRKIGVVRTAVPATYPMGQVYFGRFPQGTLWVENVLEALDEPGEWVLDVERRRLYLWPRGDRPSATIVAPQLTELLRVEGQIDYDGPADRPVVGLVFRGLTFTQADRRAWERQKTGWGLQHDWEMFDRPTAMLRLRGAERCAVENCHFVNSGGAAIRLDLHCQGNRIHANHIEHVGGVGILLAGYGPGTKNVNRSNQVTSNHIHHVGEVLWHAAGIFAWQSGANRIANNLLHHTSYTAIIVSGRIDWRRDGQGECSRTIRWKEIEAAAPDLPDRPSWRQREPFLHGRRNVIVRNEIHHAMQILGDGNCIYISGTGGGNVVRENFLHDVDSPNVNANIRCDDDQHETLMERNVIFRCLGEGFISKGNNTIRNNMVVDLRPATSAGVAAEHRRGYLVFPYGPVAGSVIERNIFYSRTAGDNVLHEGQRGGKRSLLRDCQADQNLYYNAADPQWGADYLQTQRAFGVEQRSIAADPRFLDLEHGDLRLAPDSPAFALGFEAIDLSNVGILD